MTTSTAQNRGPITTIFTPSASCFSDVYVDPITQAFYVQHYLGGDVSGCYPETTSFTNWDAYYYSPAICPSGWTTVSTLTTLSPSGPSIGPGTSAYLCCPSNFEAGGVDQVAGNQHRCESIVTIGQTLTYTTDLNPDVRSTVATSKLSVLCDGIPIVWQTTDLEILSLLTPSLQLSAAASTQASPTVAATSTQTSSTIAAATASQSNPVSPSSGLSSSAKSGIGVGAGLFVLILAMGLLAFVFRRRQQRKVKKSLHEASEPGFAGLPSHQLIIPDPPSREDADALDPKFPDEDKIAPAEVLAEQKSAYLEDDLQLTEGKGKNSQVPPVPAKVPIPPPKVVDRAVTPTAYELSYEAIPSQQELDSPSSVAVLRSHELGSDLAAFHEMDPQNRSELEEVLPEWVTRAELEAQRAIDTGGSPREVEAESVPSPSSPSSAASPRHSISRKPIGTSSPGSSGPSHTAETKVENVEQGDAAVHGQTKLKVLQDRIERIRADKERLLEIQRLTQLEEETKAEILAEQRKSIPM